tara:strand:+ start:8434 stop:8949 length:516 start_codon:yes stop_codon:yes gene_type:complete
MYQKNSLTLLFKYSRNLFFFFIISLLFSSCALQPLKIADNKISIYLDFKNNPLNKSLVYEIKRNLNKFNASIESEEKAKYIVKINEHRIGKFMESTDEELLPALINLEYQLNLEIINKTLNSVEKIPIFLTEDFSYDTESILSNERKSDEIKQDFFNQVIDIFIIFFSNTP